MKFTDGAKLIEHPILKTNAITQWADLGCGTGFFTNALSSFLAKGSTIYAVDTDAAAIKKVKVAEGINLQTFARDVTKTDWPFTTVDGIMMANALHYVRDKNTFMQQLKKHLTTAGHLLIVEYGMDTPNTWVPFPIKYEALKTLCLQHSFSSVQKINEMPSVFGRANLYAAIITC